MFSIQPTFASYIVYSGSVGLNSIFRLAQILFLRLSFHKAAFYRTHLFVVLVTVPAIFADICSILKLFIFFIVFYSPLRSFIIICSSLWSSIVFNILFSYLWSFTVFSQYFTICDFICTVFSRLLF